MPGCPRSTDSANGRGQARRETERPGPPQDSNRTSVWEPAAGWAARGPISGVGSRPPNVGPGGPAPRCCLRRRRGRASRTTTFAGRRRRWRRRSCEREPGAAAQRHVGEHGRAAAPGHDQPVRAGRGLRGRSGAAAAASGALAVRGVHRAGVGSARGSRGPRRGAAAGGGGRGGQASLTPLRPVFCPQTALSTFFQESNIPNSHHHPQMVSVPQGRGGGARCGRVAVSRAGDSHVAGERRAANVNKEPKCLPGKSAPRPALARPTLGPASRPLDRGLRPCAGRCALGVRALVLGRWG